MQDVSEAMSKLFSLCCHEVINRLQVISGLAQLNKTEKLQSSIREVSEEVYQLGRLARCGDPRLALLIYEAAVRVPENSLSFECSGTLPVLSPVSLALAAELLEACKEYLLRETSGALIIILRGGDSPSVSLCYAAASGKHSELSCFLEKTVSNDLAAALDDKGGIMTLLLDKQ